MVSNQYLHQSISIQHQHCLEIIKALDSISRNYHLLNSIFMTSQQSVAPLRHLLSLIKRISQDLWLLVSTWKNNLLKAETLQCLCGSVQSRPWHIGSPSYLECQGEHSQAPVWSLSHLQLADTTAGLFIYLLWTYGLKTDRVANILEIKLNIYR